MRTFYVDLDELNKEGAGKVSAKFEYSLRDAYNLSKINAETMNAVLERMGADESLFQEYARRNRVQFMPPNTNEPDKSVISE